MKRIGLIQVAILLMAFPLFSQTVSIPDTAFLYALIEEGVDTNGDGLVSYAESEPDSPSSTLGLSFGASTNLFAFPINLSLDHLFYKGQNQLGYTAGILMVIGGDGYVKGGGQFSFLKLSKRRNGFLEWKLGIAYYPIDIVGNSSYSFFVSWDVMPILSVGYRFQTPDGNSFFRITFGTGGIGFGCGILITEWRRWI